MGKVSEAEILTLFPFLSGADHQEHLRRLLEVAQRMSFSSGQAICREGDQCQNLAVVLNGSVRVYKLGENGREITLYRIGPGESCILTASCILSQQRFPANASVESPINVIVIPAAELRSWVATYDSWQNYIFRMMSSRFSEVIETINEISFRRVDERILHYLSEHSVNSPLIQTTHQSLASELGTAREVVSRVLKDFESQGYVLLKRGVIEVINLPPM